MGFSAQQSFDKAIESLGKRVAFKIYERDKKKVAVTNLLNHKSESNELGGLVSEELTISLLKNARDFEVMDRNHLESIFKEHRLALGGLVNEETIIELGKLQSVELVITGMVVKLGDRYKISIKALDTETARVIAADKEYFDAEEYLDDYYGMGSPAPIEPPPPPEEFDCETGNYGTIILKNSFDATIKASFSPGYKSPISSFHCERKMEVQLKPGDVIVLRELCYGNISYKIEVMRSKKILQTGTMYLDKCGEKEMVFR